MAFFDFIKIHQIKILWHFGGHPWHPNLRLIKMKKATSLKQIQECLIPGKLDPWLLKKTTLILFQSWLIRIRLTRYFLKKIYLLWKFTKYNLCIKSQLVTLHWWWQNRVSRVTERKCQGFNLITFSLKLNLSVFTKRAIFVNILKIRWYCCFQAVNCCKTKWTIIPQNGLKISKKNFWFKKSVLLLVSPKLALSAGTPGKRNSKSKLKIETQIETRKSRN